MVEEEPLPGLVTPPGAIGPPPRSRPRDRPLVRHL